MHTKQETTQTVMMNHMVDNLIQAHLIKIEDITKENIIDGKKIIGISKIIRPYYYPIIETVTNNKDIILLD